jgi:hypothetical protein
MDPTPFHEFERAQELMDDRPSLSYEQALELAKKQLRQANA